MPLRVVYSDRYLDWQLGPGHPTNPVRAQLAVQLLRSSTVLGDAVTVIEADADAVRPEDSADVFERASAVHSFAYLDELVAGRNREWRGVQPAMGQTAMTMLAGTLQAWDGVLKDWSVGWGPGVWFNPQGAKHHAMGDQGSGFCVLNDMAVVAREAAHRGVRTLYVDWDVHRGDGVEALTWSSPYVMTASIQGQGMFAGDGLTKPDHHVYNYPLRPHSKVIDLKACLVDVFTKAERFKPDLVLVAAGADGLDVDPLGNLSYDTAGLAEVGAQVGRWAGARKLPIIVGGAGGYTPLRETPVTWASVVSAMWLAHSKALRA